MKSVLAAIALASTLAAPVSAQPLDTAAEGARLAAALDSGDTGAIWRRLSPAMQAVLGSEAALAGLRAQVEAQFGARQAEISAFDLPANQYRLYARAARHARGDVVTQFAFGADGIVEGFYVRPLLPAAPSARLDYLTKARLILPLEGEWMVVWGGRTVDGNYHAVDRGQRFALDLIKVQDGGNRSGDGSKPEHYLCWDEAVRSPGDGIVVRAVDGLPDQPIGQADSANPAGNHVVLDLGDDEFLFLAHLRDGSIAVREGDRVSAGDMLGRCGNSGNTSEPHLHIHLQTSPRLGEGEGLPAQFLDYAADGTPVARGEPLRGQTLTPQR